MASTSYKHRGSEVTPARPSALALAEAALALTAAAKEVRKARKMYFGHDDEFLADCTVNEDERYNRAAEAYEDAVVASVRGHAQAGDGRR